MTDLEAYTDQQMAGILTLRHRYRELGRLRAGEQRTSAKGNRYPVKLDTFRFTSTDWRLIQRAADEYGGKPETWADAPDWNAEKQTGIRQFQVTVEADRILVSVPAQQQLTQNLEYWTAAGCQRRCNGVAMTSGEPCQCRDEMQAGSAQLCQHVTRANFVLPNIPGLGVWRLESKGVFAASELPLQIAMAAQYGPDVEWWLRLDPRSYKSSDENGKPVTYHFHVPVLDTDRTPAELFSRQADQPAIQASDPGNPPAPQRHPGSGITSEERGPRGAELAPGQPAGTAAAPPSDPNASVTESGDTDVSAGQEPLNAEATTSPVSPGDGKAGRGSRSGRGAAGKVVTKPGAPPAEPADEATEQAEFEQGLTDDYPHGPPEGGRWTR